MICMFSEKNSWLASELEPALMASDLGSSSCFAMCLSVTCTTPAHILFIVLLSAYLCLVKKQTP